LTVKITVAFFLPFGYPACFGGEAREGVAWGGLWFFSVSAVEFQFSWLLLLIALTLTLALSPSTALRTGLKGRGDYG
jgi:hypothetical protein